MGLVPLHRGLTRPVRLEGSVIPGRRACRRRVDIQSNDFVRYVARFPALRDASQLHESCRHLRDQHRRGTIGAGFPATLLSGSRLITRVFSCATRPRRARSGPSSAIIIDIFQSKCCEYSDISFTPPSRTSRSKTNLAFTVLRKKDWHAGCRDFDAGRGR